MRFLYFVIFFVFVFSCSNSKTERSKLIHFVPENASLIIRASNIESLKSSLNNSDIIEKLSQTDFYKFIESELNNLTYLKPSTDILICLSENLNDSLEYSIITNYHKQLFITDSLPNYAEEFLSYKGKTITKSKLKGITFYSTVIDSTFLLHLQKK